MYSFCPSIIIIKKGLDYHIIRLLRYYDIKNSYFTRTHTFLLTKKSTNKQTPECS